VRKGAGLRLTCWGGAGPAPADSRRGVRGQPDGRRPRPGRRSPRAPWPLASGAAAPAPGAVPAAEQTLRHCKVSRNAHLPQLNSGVPVLLWLVLVEFPYPERLPPRVLMRAAAAGSLAPRRGSPYLYKAHPAGRLTLVERLQTRPSGHPGGQLGRHRGVRGGERRLHCEAGMATGGHPISAPHGVMLFSRQAQVCHSLPGEEGELSAPGAGPPRGPTPPVFVSRGLS
jgi:hypothetical protein